VGEAGYGAEVYEVGEVREEFEMTCPQKGVQL